MQTRLGLRFVPFPDQSSSGDQVFGVHGRYDLLPPLSLPLGFLGVQPSHLRYMLTVQNPKKSWLAMKPACSLVDDAVSGAAIAPFWLWLHLPACHQWGMDEPAVGSLCSVLCSVSGPDGVLG